jgi:sRNA-binding carbon storage regulator CsrA
MLIVTRKPGQIVRIKLDPALDPMTPIRDIFAEGPIEVVVARVRDANVRLGLRAPASLVILREELDQPADDMPAYWRRAVNQTE